MARPGACSGRPKVTATIWSWAPTRCGSGSLDPASTDLGSPPIPPHAKGPAPVGTDPFASCGSAAAGRDQLVMVSGNDATPPVALITVTSVWAGERGSGTAPARTEKAPTASTVALPIVLPEAFGPRTMVTR